MELFSRYESGTQWTAGPIVGSVDGVSGLNPIVDRLNTAYPDDFNYQFIDTMPSARISGLQYFSESFDLNENFSSGRLKASYYASGTGDITWELYKILPGGSPTYTSVFNCPSRDISSRMAYDSKGNLCIEQYIDSNLVYKYVYTKCAGTSSIVIGGIPFSGSYNDGFTFDNDDNFIVSNSTSDLIYVYPGFSRTKKMGSFSSPAGNTRALATAGDNLLSFDLSNKHLYQHNGVSAGLLGSWDFGTGQQSDINDITYDGTNVWTMTVGGGEPSGTMVYKCDGISNTFLGSWFPKGGLDGHYCGIGWNGTSIVVANTYFNNIYVHEIAVKESGLANNELYEGSVSKATYPKLAIKATLSDKSDRIKTIWFDYK